MKLIREDNRNWWEKNIDRKWKAKIEQSYVLFNRTRSASYMSGPLLGKMSKFSKYVSGQSVFE